MGCFKPKLSKVFLVSIHEARPAAMPHTCMHGDAAGASAHGNTYLRILERNYE